MTRHVIIWKLKDGIENLDEVKQGIKAGLEGLAGVVPGLLRIKVYVDGMDESMVMLDSYFTSKDALKAYAIHPAHVAVADIKVRPYTMSRNCLDFEGGSEFDELVCERRSCRKFKDGMPESELVDEVVKAGLLAPTGRNQQSSYVLRINDPELRAAIVSKNSELIGGMPDPFYGAPVMLMVIARKGNGTATYDGSLTLGNMMVKAHELGLASCWIHRAKEEMESSLGKIILEKSGLPQGEWEGVGHLALGYAEEGTPARSGYDASRYVTI